MEDRHYIIIQKRQEKSSMITGLVSTVLFLCVILCTLYFSGLKFLSPPPPEKQDIVIDFNKIEDEETPDQKLNAERPKSEEVSKEIKLVQQSQAQHVGSKENKAEESTIGPKGDVEVPEPERKKEINKKALFAAANNKAKKDTLAAQTAREVSDALNAGHALGNTEKGPQEGVPQATLKGRKVNGSLPRPSAPGQQEGKVVVKIWVDNYGKVQKAQAGVAGTTVTDKALWENARKAAMAAHFNMNSDAPPMQEGTITYIFKNK